MQDSNIPSKFPLIFGVNASGADIRPIPTTTSDPNAASLSLGFPSAIFVPVGAGGSPPDGRDFNGILNQLSAWCQWLSAGGPLTYDGTFSAAIGGYANGAVIQAAVGGFWQSTVDNNTSDPDTGGDNWVYLGILSTGSWTWRPTGEILPGWVKGNGTTIGNAASGATQMASQSLLALFTWFWTNFSNVQCPVSGGRGANAAADFAANKTIGTYNMQGTGIMGMDTMGGNASTLLSGVPVINGSATIAGSLLGENLHSLIATENGVHTHLQNLHNHGLSTVATSGTVGATPNSGGATVAVSVSGGNATDGATAVNQNSGTGQAHNTVQRSAVGTHYFKI